MEVTLQRMGDLILLPGLFIDLDGCASQPVHYAAECKQCKGASQGHIVKPDRADRAGQPVRSPWLLTVLHAPVPAELADRFQDAREARRPRGRDADHDVRGYGASTTA